MRNMPTRLLARYKTNAESFVVFEESVSTQRVNLPAHSSGARRNDICPSGRSMRCYYTLSGGGWLAVPNNESTSSRFASHAPTSVCLLIYL